jgi:hypothetical protein
MGADDHRRFRPDQRRGIEAGTSLREGLAPDRIGKPLAKPCAGDLAAPGGLEASAGLAHGGRHRLLAGRDFGLHDRHEVRGNVEFELHHRHAGLRSTVQTSRSVSRTGSP